MKVFPIAVTKDHYRKDFSKPDNEVGTVSGMGRDDFEHLKSMMGDRGGHKAENSHRVRAPGPMAAMAPQFGLVQSMRKGSINFILQACHGSQSLPAIILSLVENSNLLPRRMFSSILVRYLSIESATNFYPLRLDVFSRSSFCDLARSLDACSDTVFTVRGEEGGKKGRGLPGRFCAGTFTRIANSDVLADDVDVGTRRVA